MAFRKVCGNVLASVYPHARQWSCSGRKKWSIRGVDKNPRKIILLGHNRHICKIAQITALIAACQEAKQNAYCPYSNFRVGAALLCKDGSIVKGCNVENVSYGLTVCAERTALVKAVSEGHRKFVAIAVATDVASKALGPCGSCRQFLVEFGPDWDVLLTKPDMTYERMKTRDLLPVGFFPESLEMERIP